MGKVRKTKYLSLYFDLIKNGELPKAGLCNCLKGYGELVVLMKPTRSDFDNLEFPSSVFWGIEHYDFRFDYSKRSFRIYEFNPLRQNIVLFLAAMNGEL